jgi:hypothetical protein
MQSDAHLRRWCLHAAHEGGGEGADVPLLPGTVVECGDEDDDALLPLPVAGAGVKGRERRGTQRQGGC